MRFLISTLPIFQGVNNAEYFESIVMAMNIGDIPYPQMKFLDMGFWEIGFRDNEDNVTVMPH